MNRRVPSKGYLTGPLGAGAITIARFLVETKVGSEPWLIQHWYWLLGLCGAFTLGQAVSDYLNRESWIRRKVAALNQIFVVDSVVPVSKSTEQKEWLEITAMARFTRNVRRVHIITRIKYAINLPHAETSFVLDVKEWPLKTKDETERYVIAVVPLRRSDGHPLGYQVWGGRYRESGDVEGMHSFSGGTENIMEIEMRSGWRRQVSQTFIAGLQQQGEAFGRVFTAPPNSPFLTRSW